MEIIKMFVIRLTVCCIVGSLAELMLPCFGKRKGLYTGAAKVTAIVLAAAVWGVIG